MNTASLYKFTFRYEIPKDANNWVSVYAEDETSARIYARNKLIVTRGHPFYILEMTSKELDKRPPVVYQRVSPPKCS